ncbi:MAG: alpha/beta hydrolase, partial [Candidatus Saccharimonas sp.]|nr:alpha/beta hydrolase [Planctomycetaceae bacterium]
PPVPAARIGETPPAALPPIAAPVAARPLVVRGPCDPDYSIVSTRCCKHQVECCQPCNYQVCRFDGSACGRGSSLDELYASLQPGVPVCFMAHGSFVEWDSMLQDCAATYRWLRQAAPHQPIHIVFFTWPSDDSDRLIRALDVNKMGRRADWNALYLAELIARVPEGHPISLIGHSHGARMVSATVHALAGGVVAGRCYSGGSDGRHRIRVVLAAAAIDHDWFNPGGRFDLTLCRAEAVLNLRNRHDFPLLFYPLRRPFSPAALAVTGVTHRDRCQLGEQNCRIDDCDVTHIVGTGHLWPHYYSQPDIACAIRHFVYFDE